MGLLKPFIPGTGIPLPRRPGTTTTATPYTPPSGPSLNDYISKGGNYATAKPEAGTMEARPYLSPWDKALSAQYNKANAPSEYKGDWRGAVTQAQGLAGKDFTGDLNRLGQEQVAQQQTQQANQFGALGMRELSTRADIQDDWTKRRTDTSTKAAIDAQGMQVQALDSLRTMLSGASGAELDRLQAAISAASSGGSYYNDSARLIAALELQKKNGTPASQTSPAPGSSVTTTNINLPPRDSTIWHGNTR